MVLVIDVQQHFYRSEIIERFMPQSQQDEFDSLYMQAKVRETGRAVVELTKQDEEKKEELIDLLAKVSKIIKK